MFLNNLSIKWLLNYQAIIIYLQNQFASFYYKIHNAQK